MIRRSYCPFAARTEFRCFSSDPANGLTSSSTLLPVSFSYSSTVLRKLSNQGDWLMTMVIGATLAAAANRRLPKRPVVAAPAARTCRRVRPFLVTRPLMLHPPERTRYGPGFSLVTQGTTFLPCLQTTYTAAPIDKSDGLALNFRV